MAYKDPEKAKEYQREWKRRNAEKGRESCRRWRAANIEYDRARQKAYQEANVEKVREARAQYYAEHREELNAKKRAKRAAMTDEQRAAERAYRDKTRERKNAWSRAYESSPEGRERRLLKQNAREARKLANFVEDVHSLVVLERDDGVCGICGKDVDPTDFHVDHIVAIANGGEHSYANVQTAHPLCNTVKGAR